MLAIPDPSLITGDVMRFREVSGPQAKPGMIEVHIIRPGRGSSGYYFEESLKKAVEAGVYPAGMLMHWDHPTRQQEEDQPARTTGTIAAVFAEKAHYRDEGDPNAWDGPGPYALAEVRPKFREDLKWLAGKIGVSHYVNGKAEENAVAPDGKKGVIKYLTPDPFNSVDFVTIPGAGGHSRFNEVKMREVIKHEGDKWVLYSQDGSKVLGTFDSEQEAQDREDEIKRLAKPEESRKRMAGKQLSIRLSEIMASDPEVITELRKQVAEDLHIESLNESQKKRLTEAETRVKTLEAENKVLKVKIAEKAARDYVVAEVVKAKLTETAGKSLTDTLVKSVPLAEDGSIDTAKFGTMVSEAIKGKQAEVAAILKESGVTGIHDNGMPNPGTEAEVKRAREELRDSYMESGKTREEACRLAGIEEVKA